MFVIYSLYAALSAVYALFLWRVRQGLSVLQDRRRELAQLRDAHSLDDPAWPSVTVCVPVRNERDTITACLDSVRAQRYAEGRLQVIVVDDHSDDGTADMARAAAAGDPNVEVLSLSGEERGKKAAITAAVRHSSTDVVLTTDADCSHHPDWVRSMVIPMLDGYDVVLGPVLIRDRSRPFARLQALELLAYAGVGAGLAGVGYPRLCNGANFAYRRSCFLEAGGYAAGPPLASGDDEFLLHTLAYDLGLPVEFSPLDESVVHTGAAPSLRALFRQRRRWAGKGRHYADRRFVGFLVLLFVYLLFVAATPGLLLLSASSALLAAAFGLVKLLVDTRTLVAAAALLRAPLRPGDLLIAELLHPYLVIAAAAAGAFGGGSWKDRPLRSSRT